MTFWIFHSPLWRYQSQMEEERSFKLTTKFTKP
ncbi:hypothetical protein HRbin27_01364 [bacterium HR27]|nr:hypothetical protein HRbin27_01364 [bacterium HR27]